MNPALKDWLDVIPKVMGGLGVIIAALGYLWQQRMKQAEWLKSLFEKFFETPGYKEVRVWLDYGSLNERLNVTDEEEKVKNEEKFTDFLNFFEFIGVLYSRNQLTFSQVNDVFDYYLKKIKLDTNCLNWIDKYGFEKLRNLLNRI